MAIDAVDIAINVQSDASGVIELTVHDDRLEERVQLLRTRGATKRDATWRLAVDDVGEIANIAGHLLGLIADMLNPAPTAAVTRQAAISRDENRCRICGRDFATAVNGDFAAERVVDHMFPKFEAGPEHGVHETYNLVTVCRGCDDVFLQGDAFRFVPDTIACTLGPLDRQLLAWIQKRGLLRSDWLACKLDSTREVAVGHNTVVERLRTFAQLGVLRHLPDIGPDQELEVFTVTYQHPSVVFVDKPAIHRHDHLAATTAEKIQPDVSTIGMNERRKPKRPEAIGETDSEAPATGGDST